MKRKFNTVITAFLCAVIGAACLTACGDEENDMVSCTLATTPEHVSQVQLHTSDGNFINLGTNGNGWSTPKQIKKNAELEITVHLDEYYKPDTMKMLINSVEVALTEQPNADGTYSAYSAKYTPASDFEIKLVGEAKHETIDLSFTAVDWSSFFPDNYPAGEKDLLLNNVRVKVLVNDVAAPALNGVSLTAIGSVAPLTFDKGAKVQIVFYCNNGKAVLSIPGGEGHIVVLAGGAGNDGNTPLNNNFGVAETYENGSDKGVSFTADTYYKNDAVTVFIF